MNILYDYQTAPCYLSVVPAVLRVHSIINLIYLLKNSHSQCLHESWVISYWRWGWWWDNDWHGLNCLLICGCLWFLGKSGGSETAEWRAAIFKLEKDVFCNLFCIYLNMSTLSSTRFVQKAAFKCSSEHLGIQHRPKAHAEWLSLVVALILAGVRGSSFKQKILHRLTEHIKNISF